MCREIITKQVILHQFPTIKVFSSKDIADTLQGSHKGGKRKRSLWHECSTLFWVEYGTKHTQDSVQEEAVERGTWLFLQSINSLAHEWLGEFLLFMNIARRLGVKARLSNCWRPVLICAGLKMHWVQSTRSSTPKKSVAAWLWTVLYLYKTYVASGWS